MGTDISMYAEVRRNKQWIKVGNKFKNEWYRKNKPIDDWNKPYTDHPYDDRNYALFAILADVRNGVGIAGYKTSNVFNPIAEPKGLPEDITDEVREELEDYGYGYSYFTLKELKDYDWNQIVMHFGVISEEQYIKMKETGKNPDCWSLDIILRDIAIVSADTMDKILAKTIDRNHNIRYYVQTYFKPVTYKDCCLKFYEDTMSDLELLIPKGGTDEDVRIIFAFDC